MRECMKSRTYLLIIVIAILVCGGVRISGQKVRQEIEAWKANVVIPAAVDASEDVVAMAMVSGF